MTWNFLRRASFRLQILCCLALVLLSLFGHIEHLFVASGGKKRKISQQQADSNTPSIALGYVRQSYTRDEDDIESALRPQRNIKETAAKGGYILEPYDDLKNH